MNGAVHTPGLTPRDREILDSLIFAYDERARFGWPTLSDGRIIDGVSPLDCGGMDGSDHSYRLSKLVKLGLAEHRKGLSWGHASKRVRGSKKYRPTDVGRAAIASATGAA